MEASFSVTGSIGAARARGFYVGDCDGGIVLSQVARIKPLNFHYRDLVIDFLSY